MSWYEVSRLFLECRSVLRQFGVPKCLMRVRSVLWPKCPVTKTAQLLFYTNYTAADIVVPNKNTEETYLYVRVHVRYN